MQFYKKGDRLSALFHSYLCGCKAVEWLINMKKFIKVIALTLSLIMTLPLPATALAATDTAPTSSGSYDYISDLAAKTTVIEDDALKKTLTDATLNAIQDATIKLNISESSYDFNCGQLAHVADSEESTALTVPVKGNEYSILSNLTVLFDENNQPITYSELILTKSEKNTFVIQIFTDGIETYNEITDLEYVSNTEMNDWISDVQDVYNNPQHLQPYGLDIPCFVAVSGAGATVSGLILKLCGAPCALAPPTCAVCLGGIIVIGGGSILAAVTQC